MASESSGRTFQEYLEHHLQNLVYGPLPAGHERKLYSKGEDEAIKEAYCQEKNLDYDGEKYCKETLTEDGWYLANNRTDVEAMGFWAFHVDSLLWSVLLGGIFIAIFKISMPKNTHSNSAPSGMQNFVEMCIEFVEDNVQSLFGSVKNTLIAPLALTVFVWILLMNLMDLIPVDFLPVLAGHIAYALFGFNEATGGGVEWIKGPESLYFKVVPTTDPNITLGMAFGIFVLIIY